MLSSERKIQERLGAALQGLADIEQHSGADGAGRPTQRLLKSLRQLMSDLDVAFRTLQETAAHQAALRQDIDAASRRAELLFDLSPLPCLVVHTDGVIEHANAAAGRALNTSLRLLHRRPLQLYLGGERDAFLLWLHGVVSTGEPDRWCGQIRPREQRPREVAVLAAPESGGQIVIIITPRESPLELVATASAVSMESDKQPA
jgi:PAS domain-containing protein